jgi:hypothetical protein
MPSVPHRRTKRHPRPITLPTSTLADLAQIVGALNGRGFVPLPPKLRQRLRDAWRTTVEALQGADTEQSQESALVPMLDAFRAIRGDGGVVVALDDAGRLTEGTRKPDAQVAACMARVLDFASRSGSRVAVLDRVRQCARPGCETWSLTPERNADYCSEGCRKAVLREGASVRMREKRQQRYDDERAQGLRAAAYRCRDRALLTPEGQRTRVRLLVDHRGESEAAALKAVDWEVQYLNLNRTR